MTRRSDRIRRNPAGVRARGFSAKARLARIGLHTAAMATLCTTLLWLLWPLPTASAAGATGGSAASKGREQAGLPQRARVGQLRVSEIGRRRVRGGRPADASIHLAWAAGARDPATQARSDLAAFERSAFPEGNVQHTIVSQPPEAWMRALKQPDVPVRWNARTLEYLRYFRDDPKGKLMMRAWVRRSGRYLTRLQATLRAAGVPEALAMVALAESGFNPAVRSGVGAAGLWQFMEPTGSVYGLRRDYWVDDRHDIEKSTQAAALYLKDLRARFGSWELALAAYNAGHGLVTVAVKRHNTNNYWALCEIESGLPYATTNYVPKIIAAALVFHNRKAFGVDKAHATPLPPAKWTEVSVRQSTSLKTLAKIIGADTSLLLELNAQLIRGRTPPGRGNYVVRIPSHTAAAFKAKQTELRRAYRAEATHTVQHGDTLQRIAANYRISPRALRRLNGLRDSAELRGGVVLVVPSTPGSVTPEPDRFAPLAAVPSLVLPPQHRLIFFVTTRASTPLSVANALSATWSDIVAWNDLDPHARLQSGQVLQLVVPDAFDPGGQNTLAYELGEVEFVERGSRAHLEAGLRRRDRLRRGYKVRKGDKLAKIARRFNLTLGDMARINGFSRRHEPATGDLLIVYVDNGKLRGTRKAPAPRGFVASEKSARAARGATRAPSTPTRSRTPGRSSGTRKPTRTRKPSTPKNRPPSTATSSRTPTAKPRTQNTSKGAQR